MKQLIAQPWWVNLLILVPPIAYFSWRGKRVPFSLPQLTSSGVFAVAFGFVEAAVVVYLRAAAGLLPGDGGTLADVSRQSAQSRWRPESLDQFPQGLLGLEVFREVATILMLLSVAFLSAAVPRARTAAFLWVFAIWDITYYAALRITLRWPASFADPDVLFLIPVPWLSPVWFPLLVSSLAIGVVLHTRNTQTEP